MTDNEIIKALECCLDVSPSTCKNCPLFNITNSTMVCSKIATKFALDLINRQKAEIERLKEESTVVLLKPENAQFENLEHFETRQISKEMLPAIVRRTQTEAYKECIFKIKDQIKNNSAISAEWLREYLDKILEEMESESGCIDN